jgi:transitional endoplasmic reticulum ATPase
MTKMNDSENDSKITPISGNGFKDVAGMEDIKSILTKKIINVLKDPERAEKFKIQIPIVQ